MNKPARYIEVLNHIESLTRDETDLIAVMSTAACEIYQAFDYFNWVGFYRRVDDNTLKVGPYQGAHGCLTISLDRGVCGKCARENRVQLENDVRKKSHHIACSEDTRAEIVLPIHGPEGRVEAVLDIDSVTADCFNDGDVEYLTTICVLISQRYS